MAMTQINRVKIGQTITQTGKAWTVKSIEKVGQRVTLRCEDAYGTRKAISGPWSLKVGTD